MKKTILVSGVHGVGKGYYLNSITKEMSLIEVCHVSEMIEEYKCSEDAGYKKVSDVKENQMLFLNALNLYRKRCDKTLVIDGHLCLINALNEIECIEMSVLLDGKIEGIILLQDNPQVIIDRLKQRDGMFLNCDMIQKIQEREKEYVYQLEKALNIPFRIFSTGCTINEIKKVIIEMGGS